MGIMSTCEIGALSEVAFIFKAMKQGIHISRPISDSKKFDLIATRKKLNRVQIKSASKETTQGCYKITAASGRDQKQKYTKDDVDILAFYLINIDVWYIIPVKEITSTNVRLYPHKNDHKFSRYKERWDLIV